MTTHPRYVVTAASGQLGRLVVAALAERVGADAVTAVVRDPGRASGLLPGGVNVRHGDYDRPETLAEAFSGGGRLLLISSNAIGQRTAQHRSAVEAAKGAGVERIAYTSVLHADASKLGLAEEHRQTEALIAASGIAHSLLRNGWYTENYAASITPALQHGAFIGSARDGRISSAARIDYAEAAAIALVGDEAQRVIHELAGDGSYTLAEFAAEISRQAGRTVPYVDLPQADFRGALVSAGLPEGLANLLADSDAAAAAGALFDDKKALSKLIGRPTTPFAATIATSLPKPAQPAAA
jgi:NAD(P)H dehydrogenase (quinone)